MTVAEAQQRVSSSEFTYWKAFHRINPIGSVRDDYHAAQVAWMIAKTHSGKGRGPKFENFILKFKGREKPSVEKLTANLMTWMNLYNGSN